MDEQQTTPNADVKASEHMIETHLTSAEIHAMTTEMAALRSSVGQLTETIKLMQESMITRNEADSRYALRDEIYTRADIDARVTERNTKMDELESRIFGYAERMLSEIKDKVGDTINGLIIQIAALNQGVNDTFKLAQEAIALSKANAEQISGWGALHQTQANQVIGLQHELDTTQEENREARQEMKVIRAENGEMSQRMVVAVNHITNTRDQLTRLHDQLTPVITFFAAEQERRRKREEYRGILKQAAIKLVTSTRGLASIGFMITTLTGIELGTGELSRIVHQVIRILSGG